MIAISVALAAALLVPQTRAQDALSRPSSSVSGTVVDAKTNAPLGGVRVDLVELGLLARTGADGRFTFPQLAPRAYTLTVSTIGYIFVRRRVEVAVNTDVDVTIPLTEGTGAYRETVTVAAAAARPELGVSSASELGSADLQALRGVAGDDPMRALQVLPGVVTGDEFQAQFSVRGSAPRHVGVVIDGVATPLLLNEIRGRNDSGSIAMINSDILDRAALLAGPHPERDGDWLGATAEFGVREGSRDRAQFRGAVSGTSASFVVEGPTGASHRGSWLVSGRKSYVSWLIHRIDPSIESSVDFADVQSKAVYDIGAHQQVQFLVIGGTTTYEQDNTAVANGLSNAQSHGGLASAAWRYTFGKAYVTERVSIVESDFRNLGLFGQELGRGHEQQHIARTDFAWLPGAAWSLEGGIKAESQGQTTTLRQFSSANNFVKESAARDTDGKTVRTSAWGQISRRGPGGGFAVGARSTRDSIVNLERTTPWVVAERTIGPLTFRGGAGATDQFEEIDVVKTAATPLSPERATSVDASLECRFGGSVRLQVTGFRRDEDHVLRPAAETRLVAGKRVNESLFPAFSSTIDGRSRGVEVLLQRRATNGLTGWIAYTFAHTRDTDAVTGETFDADFDQRRTLNLFVQQRLSYRSTINAKLRAGSGTPIVGYFAGTVDALTLSSTRNAVRLPPYIRLDIRADRTFTFSRTRLTVFLEVVNVLNRRNLRQAAGVINNAFGAINFTEREVPIIPSIGMRIEF